jgi:hypothetical protein
MDLQARVKQKNSQLIQREIQLELSLGRSLGGDGPHASMLIFVVAPFCAGFFMHRLSRYSLGVQLIQAFLPLGSLFQRFGEIPINFKKTS